MSPDLLDDLRTLDPVDRERLYVPPSLLRPPPRRRAPVVAAAAGIAAAVAALIVATGGDEARLSLADKAYAATTGRGVIHWVADMSFYANGKRGQQVQRVEGWRHGDVTHMLRYEFTHGKPRLTSDTRATPAGSRTWLSGTDDYSDGPPPDRDNLHSEGDPLEWFRRAYRSGRLREVASNRYRVQLAGRAVRRAGGSYTLTYVLDAKSGVPRRVVLDGHGPGGSRRSVMVSTISTYERLPDTRANRAKLALLPHPGAGPSNISAEDHFAVLRTGRPPSATDAKLIARIAGHTRRPRIDATGARAIGPRVYLVPGRGYVCVFAVTTHPRMQGDSIGGGCQTVKKALESGVGTGSPSFGVWLAVPDGVRMVRARVRGKGWRTVDVKDNAVNLPFATIQKRLLR